MKKIMRVDEFLEHFSRRIIKIAIPVVLCLLIDAFLTRYLEETSGSANLDRSFGEIVSYNDGGFSFEDSMYTALGILISLIIVTALLVILYVYNCIKVIMAWMVLATSLLLSLYFFLCISTVPEINNTAVDWITLAILIANVTVIGNLSIFWRAPQVVTQFFMTLISILVAIVFLSVPDWTVWAILVLLIFYDMIVVLCPNGLLKVLIEKSQERGDPIPALLYTTSAFLPMSASSPSQQSLLEGLQDVEMESTNQAQEEEDEEDGIKLGLGDFVFYGILVTRAARLGWDVAILCVFAVILGLSLTLVFLAVYQRPLPALPFSLLLGMLFFTVATLIYRGFWTKLRENLAVF